MEKKNKKSGRVIGIICAIVAVLAAVIVALTGFITDWMWFKEMGYVSVFFTEIRSKLVLGIPTFVGTTLLGVLFLSVLKKNFLRKNDFSLSDTNKKRIRVLMWVISIIFGIIFAAVVIDSLWFEILKFLNAGSFNIADPLFNKDVGFYVFKLEFLNSLASLAVQFIVLLLALTVIFYLILLSVSSVNTGSTGFASQPEANGKVEFEYDGQPEEEKDIHESFTEKLRDFDIRAHEIKIDRDGSLKAKLKALLGVASGEIIVIGILFFVAVAVKFWLMQYNLLYGGTGVAYGAGFADIAVTLTCYRIIMICSLISAAMIVVAIKRKKFLLGVIFPLVILACIFLEAPITSLIQSYVVAPDEINKEQKYIGYNIEYTRQAYDLSDIAVKDFKPANTLTKEDVLNNMETFSNIRINDFEPAEQFYNQTQSIRSYYTFNDVDVDRYSVNGEYTQVFLAAREIDQTRVEDNWLIKHLKYTHGYGITLSRVDKVTSSGQPDMLIDSIPPVSEVPEIKINRPEIYYGERTDEYVIVGANEQEFDYPSGESNVYCEYEGTGGIPLTFGNKLMFAMREGSMKLLVSSNIDSSSRIMIYRDIMDRVRKIAPFLSYDNSPYMVVDNSGRLFWIIDAYTSSEYYPYSEPYAATTDINYVRNSVKIVIDAYNGTTDFYIADDNDPIVRTLAGIYPGLFKELSEMPADLRAHIQYPNAIFQIQASVYMKYHMTNEEVFYQSEDLWAISNELYGQTEMQLTPINFIMKLPGEKNAEFISSIPYTPNGKSNMTGILVARSDGENYGQLVLYRMPKDRIIYGPMQIEAQINQDAEISKEFSLWNNSGASYSRGNLFVFPVEDSLLYAEPIYMESSSSSLPEVKRVIMYYGDKVAYENTLADCLDKLFGEGAGAPLLTANPIEEGYRLAEELANPPVIEPPVIDEIGPNETDVDMPDGPGEVDPENNIAPGELPSDKEMLQELITETAELLNKLQQYLETLE